MIRTLSLSGKPDLRLLSIFVAGIVVRTLYAILAPLSPDWRNWYLIAIEIYQNPGIIIGVYTVPPYILAAFYVLWLVLPVPHLNPATIVTFPWTGGAPPYFQPNPATVVFVLIMKLPALISDTVTAFFVYLILRESGVSRNRTHFAIAAWLLNPLTMVMSNYNGVDAIGVMLVTAAAYWVGRKRYGAASLSLIIGGLMRLLPFIALPFLLVKTVRARDWKGVLSTSLPIVVVFAGIYTYLALFRPEALGLFQGRPGLYVPEVLDIFGSAMQLRGSEYAEDVITLMTFSYVILLAIVTQRSEVKSQPSVLVLAPFLAYTAFAWSWPPLMEYAVPLILIQLARGKGYRTLIVILSITGLLWSLVQEGTYVCLDGASFFFIPFYDKTLQTLNMQCLNAYALILSSGLSVQIRGAFSALLVLLIARMIYGHVHADSAIDSTKVKNKRGVLLFERVQASAVSRLRETIRGRLR